MPDLSDLTCRRYVSYSGVKLPLKLVAPLDDENADGRITFFRGYYDDSERLVFVEKVVYGEIEFSHSYQYDDDGKLKRVEMIEDDDSPRVLQFD